MYRFFRNLLLFISPIIILFCVVSSLGIYSGEALHPRIIAQLQASSCDSIYTKKHMESLVTYRMAELDNTQAEVFIIGSSISTQFRAQLLDEPDKFFNVSLELLKIESIASFFEQVVLRSPNAKIILVEVNPIVFNSEVDDEPEFRFEDFMDLYNPVESENLITYLIEHSNNLLRGLILNEEQIEKVLLREPYSYALTNIKLLASHISGYRCDGSLMRATDIIQGSEVGLEEALEEFKRNKGFIRTGNMVSPMRLAYVEQILQQAQQTQIQIIGYTPPFENQTYEIIHDTGDYRFVDLAIQEVQALFDEYDYPYADLSDPNLVGAESRMFNDTIHPNEFATLLIYIELLERYPELLGAYSDIDRLRSVADTAQDLHRVFPPMSPYSTDDSNTQDDILIES